MQCMCPIPLNYLPGPWSKFNLRRKQPVHWKLQDFAERNRRQKETERHFVLIDGLIITIYLIISNIVKMSI